MHPSVRAAFSGYLIRHEGYTTFMYADKYNLVHTGIGNLIDLSERDSLTVDEQVMAPAFKLPWRLKGEGWTTKNDVCGRVATVDEVRGEWKRVKLDPINGKSPLKGWAYAAVTTLALDLNAVQRLFDETLSRFENVLKKRFPNWETWPADAQIATLDLAWSLGPNFKLPGFEDAAARDVFRGMGIASFSPKGGGTPSARSGRNLRNLTYFNAAAVVVAANGDRSQLSAVQFPSNGPRPANSGITETGLSTHAKVGVGLGVAALAYWLFG